VLRRKYRLTLSSIAERYPGGVRSATVASRARDGIGRAKARRYENRSISAFQIRRRALEVFMSAIARKYRNHAAVAIALVVSSVIMAHANECDGVVRVKSAYGLDETIDRIKKDVANKGIRFFSEIDQAKLAADAGIKLRPSTLLEFGNPPLGTQFITADSNAGLDWPVRLLVTQEDDGSIWTVYSDFGWIARRHAIRSRDAQFKMATQVISSITSSIAVKK
jgi:uncharacterized protein (DUF302 family)